MLSYQHGYHAGNFADVHKHATLALCLDYLCRAANKDAPMCYIDTHSGRGSYDLRSATSAQTGEWQAGIGRLWPLENGPAILAPYRQTLRAGNAGAELTVYPGSPAIARTLCRGQDRLLLLELHQQEFSALRAYAAQDARVHCHRRDAHEGLPALVPPPEKRGLVLLDPSYEVKDEYAQTAATVLKAHRRWPQAVYMVWYPLLAAARHQELIKAIGRAGGDDDGVKSCLRGELSIASVDASGLFGSGLLIINPPWPLAEQLRELQQVLQRALAAADAPAPVCDWLVAPQR